MERLFGDQYGKYVHDIFSLMKDYPCKIKNIDILKDRTLFEIIAQ